MDRDISLRVLVLNERVVAKDIPGLIETVPTFHSLLIRYDPLRVRFEEIQARVDSLAANLKTEAQPGRRWRLPVCYETDFAPDLTDVADRCGLSPSRVIEMHSERAHHVYMVGFLAGCPYLGDLPDALSLPRRSDPRLRVPKGSVAIALTMTIVYPVISPGGWHLIGKTPFEIFDAAWQRPALFKPGDKIEFEAISPARFEELEKAVLHDGHCLEPVSA